MNSTSQTVYLSSGYTQSLSAYAPFSLTIDPGSVPVTNKVYKISYDFGDGSTHDQLLDLTKGSPLQFPQTHQYFLTGSFVKNIIINVDVYTFNTSSNINYKIYLNLNCNNLERNSILEEGLCAYYNFNGDKKDATKNNRDLLGTYNKGSSKIGTGSATFGTYGTCYSGPGLYYLTNLWNAYGGESGSYSFWFYYSTEITWPGGCSYGIFGQEFGNMGMFASFDSGETGKLIFGIHQSPETTIQDPNALEVGNWYHIAMVHDAVNKTLKVYKNGVLLESKTYNTLNQPWENFQGFGINGTTWGSSVQYGVPCRFDAVGLWKRALSEEEVGLLYNNGNGLEYPFNGLIKELHLVGSRMFGPNDDILYFFESIEPNYILPVLVNWDEKPKPAPKITIPPEYRPFKLLAPFENEAVTSIDYGSHVYSAPDGEGKYLPDPGNVNQIKIYDGSSIASRFFAYVDNNWSNIANWETDGGNSSLYFPTTSINVTVFAPIRSVSDGIGYARNINFNENSYLKDSTLVVQESAIFHSNSYNLGSISGNAYFLDNSYNLGFEPTLLSLNTQGSDGSTIIIDSSNYNRILTSTGNPYITSYPSTPNTLVSSGLVFHLDAEGYTGDGSTWVDSISGVVGTAQNSPTYVADSPSYFYLNGNSQAFNFTRWNSAVNLNNNFSLEAWVNIKGNNEWGGIISLATGGYENFGRGQGEQYSLNTTYGQYFRFDINTGNYLNGPVYQLNDWVHVVVTYQSGVSKTYTNGALADTQTLGSIANTIQDAYLSIGCNQYGGFEYMNGQVGLVSIYNKVLSPLEILQNFNAKKTRFNKTAPFGSFLYFDGNSKIQPLTGGKDFGFDLQDFTIEGWICPTRNNGTSQVFYDSRYQYWWDGYYHPLMYLRSGLYLTFNDGYSDIIQGEYIPLNTWNHVAVSRNNNQTKLFLNGKQTGGTVTDTKQYKCNDNLPLIGSSFDNYNFKGFVEYFKVTKGIGKYTTNFIPPTAVPVNDLYITGEVSDIALFKDNSFNLGTLTNAIFSGNSINYGFVTSAVFTGNSQNSGVVINADVYYPVAYPLSGVYTNVTYYGYVFGCTDPNAINYNPNANMNDGSCQYSLLDGIVAYYNMDETSGTRLDVTGNGYDIVEVNGTITNDQGVIDKSAYIENGTLAWLNLPAGVANPTTINNQKTYSLWFNLSGNIPNGKVREILTSTNMDWSTGLYIYTFNGYNGEYMQVFCSTVDTNNSVWINTLAPIPKNQWNHLVVTINGPIMKVYFNGVLQGQQNTYGYVNFVNDNLPYSLNHSDGANNTYDYAGPMSIDEFGIWNKELQQIDVTTLYNAGSGLTYPFNEPLPLLNGILSYWKMDETTGTRYDSTTNGYNLSDNNNVGYGSGIINNGAQFDGTNFLSISNPTIGLGDFTVSLWVNASTQITPYPVAIALDPLSNSGQLYILDSIATNGFRFDSYAFDNTLTENSWNHFVISRLSGSVSIYLNGVFVDTISDATDISSEIDIGTTNNQYIQDAYYNGLIDEVGMWNRALSQMEITNLYNSGIGLTYPFGN